MKEYMMYFKNGDNASSELFMNNHGKELADGIKNNPAFLSSLQQAIMAVVGSAAEPNVDVPVYIEISNDGQELVLRSKVRKSPINHNPDLQDNISFDQVRFHLEGDNLVVTNYTGEMYNLDDYKKTTSGEFAEKLAPFDSNRTPTLLSTFYTNTLYTNDGIQLSYSTYKDYSPLGCRKDDSALLRETISSHCPQRWQFGYVPSDPQFAYHASASTVFRYPDRLGMAEYVEVNGIDAKNMAKEYKRNYYAVNTEWPERLGIIPNSLAHFEDRDIVLSDSCKSLFPNLMTYDEVEREISKQFIAGLDNSRTKDTSPLLYDKMREMSALGLKRRYGIDVPEVSESEGMKR